MRRPRAAIAFSLIELTLAMGVGAFCLLTILGLIPVAVQTNRNATSQTRATNITTAVMADLRATPKANGTSAEFGVTFGTSKTIYFNSEGQASCDVAGTQKADCVSIWTTAIQPRYRVSITFPAGPTGLSYTSVRITWPAPVDPATTTPAGSVEIFAAIDRN